MAKPVEFKGCNLRLAPAAGTEGFVGPLPSFNNGIETVSCWELSDAELGEILATRRVYISVMAGPSQPPVFVGSETTVREAVADNGVWKR